MLVSAPNIFGRVAVDATAVYYGTYEDERATGKVMKIPKAGGESTTLALASPSEIVVDATSIYWTDYQGNDDRHGAIMKLVKDAGEPTFWPRIRTAPTASRWTPPACTGRTTTAMARTSAHRS